MELETARLKLRQWKDEDYPIFAEINADPQVMEYFPNTLIHMESHRIADKFRRLIDQRGWGLWAIELKENSAFIGFTGLHVPKPNLPFSPCVEIGWRLMRDAWGFGYASEAAKEALKVAFEKLFLKEIIAYTTLRNQRSQSVMKKLGMIDTKQNFHHPDIDPGDPLREHVLYKVTLSEWSSETSSPES